MIRNLQTLKITILIKSIGVPHITDQDHRSTNMDILQVVQHGHSVEMKAIITIDHKVDILHIHIRIGHFIIITTMMLITILNMPGINMMINMCNNIEVMWYLILGVFTHSIEFVKIPFYIQTILLHYENTILTRLWLMTKWIMTLSWNQVKK